VTGGKDQSLKCPKRSPFFLRRVQNNSRPFTTHWVKYFPQEKRPLANTIHCSIFPEHPYYNYSTRQEIWLSIKKRFQHWLTVLWFSKIWAEKYNTFTWLCLNSYSTHILGIVQIFYWFCQLGCLMHFKLSSVEMSNVELNNVELNNVDFTNVELSYVELSWVVLSWAMLSWIMSSWVILNWVMFIWVIVLKKYEFLLLKFIKIYFHLIH
jgi:hypothetical protein